MAKVYLGIYECPRHHYRSICVDPLDDSGGYRLTPSKCCGSWSLVKRWEVNAEDTVKAIQKEAEADKGEHKKHPRGDYCSYCLAQWPCEESAEAGGGE